MEKLARLEGPKRGDVITAGGGSPLPHQIESLGSTVSSPSRGSDEAPATKRFSYILGAQVAFPATLSNNLYTYFGLKLRDYLQIYRRGIDPSPPVLKPIRTPFRSSSCFMAFEPEPALTYVLSTLRANLLPNSYLLTYLLTLGAIYAASIGLAYLL